MQQLRLEGENKFINFFHLDDQIIFKQSLKCRFTSTHPPKDIKLASEKAKFFA